MKPLVICAYVQEHEIAKLKSKLNEDIDVYFWQDQAGIGSDMAYQRMWNDNPDRDIIILHSDMEPIPEDTNNNWYNSLIEYAGMYPKAGMIGMKLLYPVKSQDGNLYIQSVGGKFENNEAIHITGTLELYTGKSVRDLAEDKGQYDTVRKVPWTTFGGVYIRREVLREVGNFDPSYFYTYYRDVDYCLRVREKGWDIIQVPTPFLHFEGKTNKLIMQQNQHKQYLAGLNRSIFLEKWLNNPLMSNFDEPYNE